MSTPIDVLPDSTILSRFLHSMPSLFSLDPISQNAIEFIAIHPQPIKLISFQQTGLRSVTITHETNANFKNFPLGSSVFLSVSTPSGATTTEIELTNILYDVNEYSNEGTFVFSHEYFQTEGSQAFFANKKFYENSYIYLSKMNTAQFISGTKKILGMAESDYLGYRLFIDACILAKTNKNYVYFSEETTKENPSIYVSDLFLNLTSSYSYYDPEYIDLSVHSIKSLVQYFQDKYSSLIMNGKGGIKVLYDDALTSFVTPAARLIEGGIDFNSTGISWPVYTNENFKLLIPLVLMIREYKKDISSALKQTNQSLAREEWLEYWGKILNVPRQTVEIGLDEMYRSRMQRETLLPKSNNWALAELIEASTGQEARVTDGAQPFQIVYPSVDATNKDPKNRISSFIPYISTQEGNPFVGTNPTSITLATTSPFLTGTITIVGSTFGIREYLSAETYVTVPIPVGAIVSFRPASTEGANMNEGIKSGSITNIQSTSTSIVFTHSVGAFTVGSAVTITGSSNSLYNNTWIVSSSTSTTCTILTGLSIQTPAAGATLGTISGYVKNIITVTGKPDTTSLTISSTLPMTAGTIGYLSVTNIFPEAQGSYYPIYSTDIPASVTTLGPSTGSGTFIVKVYPDENQNLSQSLSTFVYTLVNRYKPAGLSFTIEPLIT